MRTFVLPLLFVGIAVSAVAKPPTDQALNELRLPDVQITSIAKDSVRSDDDTLDVVFYDVEGVIGGTIKFELLLPYEWNGRFVMGGGGGFVGSVQNHARGSVKYGYATVGTDTGHEGSDGSFALNDALAQVNFGHLAVHRTAEVAKAIIREHYGVDAKHSYFLGCSRGGGQAMMASQRYPGDFDGIVAGAPAYDWNGVGAAFLRVTQAFYPNPEVLDKTILTNEEIKRLIEDIKLRFDEQDGLKDGIISDPRSVEFSIDSVSWLSDEQRAAIRTIYEGPSNADGPIHPGFPVGSEIEWFPWLVGPLPNRPEPSLAHHFGVGLFRYFVFNDADWDYTQYDFSTWAEDTEFMASNLNADSTDLRAFRDRGGKLILWHGWADAALSATATINYYDALLADDPKAPDYTRLYLIPGCGHCGGGPGISNVDWLEVIVDWVENGNAPGVIDAFKARGKDGATVTRPLSPYPQQTVYSGSGDPDVSTSFRSISIAPGATK